MMARLLVAGKCQERSLAAAGRHYEVQFEHL